MTFLYFSELSAFVKCGRVFKKIPDQNGPSMFTIRAQAHKKTWRNAVALNWGKIGTGVKPITLNQGGGNWEFRIGRDILRFNWSSGKAKIILADRE